MQDKRRSKACLRLSKSSGGHDIINCDRGTWRNTDTLIRRDNVPLSHVSPACPSCLLRLYCSVRLPLPSVPPCVSSLPARASEDTARLNGNREVHAVILVPHNSRGPAIATKSREYRPVRLLTYLPPLSLRLAPPIAQGSGPKRTKNAPCQAPY